MREREGCVATVREIEVWGTKENHLVPPDRRLIRHFLAGISATSLLLLSKENWLMTTEKSEFSNQEKQSQNQMPTHDFFQAKETF